MDETSWRNSLAAGDPLDVYDGKVWRESAVLSAAVDGGGDGDALAVRFRNEIGHQLATTRGAGAARAQDAKPSVRT